jgi:hypothetical protein
MNSVVPGSLVQIHFHDRIGGVRRTIETYARTFAAIAGSHAPNLLLCNSGGTEPVGCCRTVPLPGMDYHTFRTRPAYRTHTDRLAASLRAQLSSPALRFPVAVVAHNLNLGKNPALAAALFKCAREFGGGDGNYRFFLVMHDFAEAGRCRQMAVLRILSDVDRTVYRELYGAGSPVHYIVPDRFSARVAGLKPTNLSVLPHPVADKSETGGSFNKEALRASIRTLAAGDGLHFDIGKPLYCFPSRMIYRKNGLEALLVATILLEGSLITGSCGRTADDRKRFGAMVRIAREFKCSLALDPARLSGPGMENASYDPFRPLYSIVEAVISSSIAEGYGYSLVEPWVFQVPVLGRYPAGIALPPELSAGLYRRLPVPVSWVSLDRAFDFHVKSRTAAFGKVRCSRRSFIAAFVLDNSVDFGLLDTGQQTAIILRLLRSGRDRARWQSALEKKSEGWPGSVFFRTVSADTIRRNRDVAVRRNGDAFEKSFVNILRSAPQNSPANWHHNPAEFYRNEGRFLTLEPPPRR